MLWYVYFSEKKSLPKFLLGNYLKYVDLVVARPDISKPISMDHFYLKIQINYSIMHIKLKIMTNVIY